MTLTYPSIKIPTSAPNLNPGGLLSPTGELGQLLHTAGQETEPSAEAEAVKQRRLAAIAESQCLVWKSMGLASGCRPFIGVV